MRTYCDGWNDGWNRAVRIIYVDLVGGIDRDRLMQLMAEDIERGGQRGWIKYPEDIDDE